VELGHYHEQHGKAYETVRYKSKIRFDHRQANQENDINHIDYVINHNDEIQVRECTQFISCECCVQSIPLHGTLDDWRVALHKRIKMEQKLHLQSRPYIKQS
jgi:hypothetical protein